MNYFLLIDVIPKLSPDAAMLYINAGDFMKMGKWMMFRVDNKEGLEDLKQFIAVKASK